MDTQYTRTFVRCQRREGKTAVQALPDGTIQRLTDHALARHPNQQRAPQGMQGFHVLEQA
ncbi:hypothetical protein D3C75_1127630 [compost metagenome]